MVGGFLPIILQYHHVYELSDELCKDFENVGHSVVSRRNHLKYMCTSPNIPNVKSCPVQPHTLRRNNNFCGHDSRDSNTRWKH